VVVVDVVRNSLACHLVACANADSFAQIALVVVVVVGVGVVAAAAVGIMATAVVMAVVMKMDMAVANEIAGKWKGRHRRATITWKHDGSTFLALLFVCIALHPSIVSVHPLCPRDCIFPSTGHCKVILVKTFRFVDAIELPHTSTALAIRSLFSFTFLLLSSYIIFHTPLSLRIQFLFILAYENS
jgi:hypothetical protein